MAPGLDRTRSALLGWLPIRIFNRSFGRQEDVDRVHHLIGTAAGCGRLQGAEATSVEVAPNRPVVSTSEPPK